MQTIFTAIAVVLASYTYVNANEWTEIRKSTRLAIELAKEKFK